MKKIILITLLSPIIAGGTELPTGRGHIDASLFPNDAVKKAVEKQEKKESFIIVDGQKRFKRTFKKIK